MMAMIGCYNIISIFYSLQDKDILIKEVSELTNSRGVTSIPIWSLSRYTEGYKMGLCCNIPYLYHVHGL